MDNHADKLDFAKGYLAGMIDGEGTITLNIYKNKAQPFIQIVNTNPIIMDCVSEYANKLGLPFHIRTSKFTTNQKYKPVIVLSVCGIDRCIKWLESINIIGKKKNQELLLKWCYSRKKVIQEHPMWKPYSQDEVDILNEIRRNNQNGGKSKYKLKIIKYDEAKVENRNFRIKKTQELVNKGWKQERIAKFFGINSQSSISKWIKRNQGISTTTIGTSLIKDEGIV